MRVIEQARLWFREGTSDKVYEIDLVELAPGQHVVNFRFGRRGTALRDGTKTALPVDLAKARTIFGKLVAEKQAGGYKASDVAPPAAAVAAAPVVAAPGGADIVAELRKGSRSKESLVSLVQRAGERDLADAEPPLLELLDSPAPSGVQPGAWRYLVLAALARCGSTASLPALRAGLDGAHWGVPHKELARIAIARIDPARGLELSRGQLAPAIAAAHAKRDATATARAVEELLASDAARARASVMGLCLLDEDDEVARAAVLAAARIARLAGHEAGLVRALFRAAEARRDGELYALVARRIDAHTSPYRPFGTRTRGYVRRRVARLLRRLGRAGSSHYTAMAADLLLAYSDTDAQPVRTGYATYPAFAKYHALNEVLYANSPRYEKANHRKATWRCNHGYRPGGPAPAQREEAFTALWDRAPDALWRLIAHGRAAPVVEFAVRALRGNTAFITARSDDELAAVLGGGHPLAQLFAFEIARPRAVTATLARGALASEVAEAHAWMLAWLDAHGDEAAADAEMIALVVSGKTPAIREAALRLLRGRTLTDAVARSAAARVLAILLALPDTAGEHASGAVATLLRTLDAPLREISVDVLRDLLRHGLAALGELAGELVLRHAHRDALPADLVEIMLTSPHATVRTLGGRLLAQTPADLAKDDIDALFLFATSANAELREATRALIGEVARRFPDAGRALADRLVDALLRTLPPGAPAHAVSLMRAELASCLPQKPAALILKLIGALSPHARDAGGLLVPQLDADDIGLDDLARLASHENAAVRAGSWALARRAIDRYRLAPVALAKLVDAAWDDTRAWAMKFITDEVGADRLGPDAIITICDSIRPEVQELGKRLLHAQFRVADGARYVARLAEHPSPNIQLLVSSLLDRHVTDAAQLVPFLATVLSQVNRGGAAKARAIELIRREATRTPEAAAALAPLLERQSATAAITQKYPLIATMVEVHERFPEVPLPIRMKP